MLVRVFASFAMALGLTAILVLLGSATGLAGTPAKLIEPPMLAEAVAAGELPPVAERLPEGAATSIEAASPNPVAPISSSGMPPSASGRPIARPISS